MWIRRLLSRAGGLGRLFGFLWRERIWWMIPMVILLLLVAGLVFFSQSQAVTPFIYTVF